MPGRVRAAAGSELGERSERSVPKKGSGRCPLRGEHTEHTLWNREGPEVGGRGTERLRARVGKPTAGHLPGSHLGSSRCSASFGHGRERHCRGTPIPSLALAVAWGWKITCYSPCWRADASPLCRVSFLTLLRFPQPPCLPSGLS